MIFKIEPASKLKGTIALPASKSYSIRAFLVAACGGTSQIIRPSDCDDARVAMSIAKYLGASVTRSGKDAWRVRAGVRKSTARTVSVGESGTVLRFLLPLLSLQGRSVTVNGTGTLRGRPNHHLCAALRQRGMTIAGKGPSESVPIRFSAGELQAGTIVIEGGLSSQFISALLITCPQLPEDSRIEIKGRTVVSSDYVTMTRQVLKDAGVKIHKAGDRLYRVHGRQPFRGLKSWKVPSDYGLAAFLLAAGCLVPSSLNLQGHFPRGSIQADGRILDLLRQMGARVKSSTAGLKISGPVRLKGGTFSLKDCPDLVPIMAVLALFARGKTRLTNVAHARAKESDRISDLRRELMKAGARVRENKGGLMIEPYTPDQLARAAKRHPVLLDPHKDHRLAMAFSVLGLKLPVRVKDIECVRKSYPGFVRDFKRLVNYR